MSFKRLSQIALPALLAGALLAGCERPPVNNEQRGFRGLAMGQVTNPRIAATLPSQSIPEPQPVASQEGPKASQAFQNVKVLGDLSVAEFTRTMAAITSWVSPKQGCGYCHNVQNFADDGVYTKVVARRMLEMTRHVNADWQPHVAATGVTCYTCHRGNPVPERVWFSPKLPRDNHFIGDRAGQNAPSRIVAMASLPNDPFSAFLLNAGEVRVAAIDALPEAPSHSIAATEQTYGLMMHISQSLGVNCTYCHNSRAFANWSQSTPQRVTAWQGIRMARDLNQAYLVPLASAFPANRKGPLGDAAKLNCDTCHQGVSKPLKGQAMAKDYPALKGMPAPSAAPAVGNGMLQASVR